MLFDLSADPGTPDTRSPSRLLWWLAGQQAANLVWGAVFGVAWMVLQAAIPLALGNAVEAVVRHDRGALLGWTAVMGALGVGQAVAGILRHRRAVANFMLAAIRLSQIVTRETARLGHRVSARLDAGEVANLGSSDVERVAELYDTSARFAGGVVSYVAVTVVLLVAQPLVGAVVALGAVVVVLAVAPLLRPIERRQSLERTVRARASAHAADTVVGLRVLRGLGGEAVFSSRFRSESQAVRVAAVRTAHLQSYLDAGQAVLPQALVVAVTWLAAHLALRHQLNPGHLVTIYAYAAFLVLPVQTVVEMSSKATAARVGAGHLIRVLTIPDDLSGEAGDPGAVAEPRPAAPRGVPGELYDPSTGLVVAAGSFTAVVAGDPETAAALVERLGGWTEPAPGRRVSVGGVALSDHRPGEVRRRIVAIGRAPVLLAGPLGDAFRLPGASGRVGLDDALEAAAATEIVAGLAEGLATELPEGARSLSGGQRQRVVLAQALLADPDVLVLDEPTSAVDAHTEAAIARGLAAVRRNRTTVVCTTSPLLLAAADRVVLLDGAPAGGVVVDEGTHHELLRRSRRYRDVVARGLDEEVGRR